ncbi:DUF3027 domain-containing protein [Nocardia sp. NPDC055165]
MSAVSVSESGVRPVLADAAEVARRALVALEPDGVGVHLGVSAEDDTAATHRFEATLPGYRGWQWAVVVAAPPGADHATVSESALLPALDALIAPDFVPWEQRVRPGDLGPGDLLAAPADDPRLVPGYVATGDPVIDEVAREVGLGRVQVLSLEGRADAAQRWFTEFGPDTEMAKAAPGTCGMCGFYLPLAGALRESFGVCGNAMGADGHVVHIEYGCGAHSDVVAPSGNGSPLYEAFDDHAVDFVEIVRPAVEDAIDKATSQTAAADSATEAAAETSADAPASAAAAPATGSDSASAAAAPATGEDSASETASQATAEVSATVVDQVEAEPAGADPATVVVEVVAETSADPAIEVVEVAAETVAAVSPTSDTETEPSSADSLTEVGEAAAERAGDRQETAEAEAVAAADAERHALTEGALPESADEVVTAEIASDTRVPAETVSAEPAVEAELAVGDESATAETSAASDAESSSGASDEVATAADAVAEAAPAAETVSGAEASVEGEAAVSGAEASVEGEAAVSGAEASVEGEAAVSDAEASAEGEAAVSGDAGSGEAAESADLSEHGSSVSR